MSHLLDERRTNHTCAVKRYARGGGGNPEYPNITCQSFYQRLDFRLLSFQIRDFCAGLNFVVAPVSARVLLFKSVLAGSETRPKTKSSVQGFFAQPLNSQSQVRHTARANKSVRSRGLEPSIPGLASGHEKVPLPLLLRAPLCVRHPYLIRHSGVGADRERALSTR